MYQASVVTQTFITIHTMETSYPSLPYPNSHLSYMMKGGEKVYKCEHHMEDTDQIMSHLYKLFFGSCLNHLETVYKIYPWIL